MHARHPEIGIACSSVRAVPLNSASRNPPIQPLESGKLAVKTVPGVGKVTGERIDEMIAGCVASTRARAYACASEKEAAVSLIS